MSQTGPNSLLSSEEIEAALAEIETLTPGQDNAIPDLGDGSDDPVHYVPVKSDSAGGTSHSSPMGGAGADDVVRVQGPAALCEGETEKPSAPARRRSRWAVIRQVLFGLWPKRAPKTPRAAAESGMKPATTASLHDADRPETDRTTDSKRSWGAFIYDTLDRWLETLSKPFSPTTRRWIGLVAAVTLITSALAMTLFPLLYPNRDGLWFLNQKNAELLMANANEAAPPDEAP